MVEREESVAKLGMGAVELRRIWRTDPGTKKGEQVARSIHCVGEDNL